MALQEAPELVLMDVRLSGEKDGVDAANEIYKTRVIPIVYVTASRERTTSVRIRQDLPAEVRPRLSATLGGLAPKRKRGPGAAAPRPCSRWQREREDRKGVG